MFSCMSESKSCKNLLSCPLVHLPTVIYPVNKQTQLRIISSTWLKDKQAMQKRKIKLYQNKPEGYVCLHFVEFTRKE